MNGHVDIVKFLTMEKNCDPMCRDSDLNNLGERWVVFGPNGAGKTTLLQVASTYQFPAYGSARILGELMGRTDVRMKGSHRHFHHPTKGGTVTIAGPPKRDLPKKTWRDIQHQAGLK